MKSTRFAFLPLLAEELSFDGARIAGYAFVGPAGTLGTLALVDSGHFCLGLYVKGRCVYRGVSCPTYFARVLRSIELGLRSDRSVLVCEGKVEGR